MAVYYVERDYKIDVVYLFVKCPECGLNMEASVYSDQHEITISCKCCEHMIYIKILVCPECNSSANIIELQPGVHECKTCEKLVNWE